MEGKKVQKYDKTLLGAVLGLLIIGLLAVYSASYYYSFNTFDEDTFFMFRKHFAMICIGLVGMYIFSRVNYKVFKRNAFLIFAISIGLLGLIFVPGVGEDFGKGATRWIGVGGLTFMPSEFAKYCAIVFVAFLLENNQKHIESFQKGVMPVLGIVFVYVGLIILQPDFSTSVVYVATLGGMIFFAGMKLRHLFALLFCAGGAGVAAIMTAGYRMDRLTGFMDPFSSENIRLGGWQIVQSLLAFGNGGLFGVGFTKAVQNKKWIPEPANDFIFATIGEEFGFIGTSAVIILYIVFIWRCFKVAINAPDLFSCLLVSGVTLLFSIQIIMNIAVATASMPVTGIPLPFMSYGGNAIIYAIAIVGVILNISKKS